MAYEHEQYDPKQFRDERFAADNNEIFLTYVTARVNGHMPPVAFRRAFGVGYRPEDYHQYSEQVEQNPWFVERFAAELMAMPLEKLWNNKIAINSLRQMTLDPNVKCATRLAAVKELNVLSNITFVDDTGRTRASKNLNDFYGSLPEQDAETEEARAAALKAAGLKEPEAAAEHSAPESPQIDGTTPPSDDQAPA